MAEGKGTISSNDLMMKLVQAKKVMNKVETGSFERGNVNESALLSSPEEYMNSAQVEPQSNIRPMSAPSVDKIQNSKLSIFSNTDNCLFEFC